MLGVDGMRGAGEKVHFSNFSRLTEVAEGAGSKCENEGSPSEGLLVVAGVSVEDFQLPRVHRILIDGPGRNRRVCLGLCGGWVGGVGWYTPFIYCSRRHSGSSEQAEPKHKSSIHPPIELVSRRHSGSNKQAEPKHKSSIHPPIELNS